MDKVGPQVSCARAGHTLARYNNGGCDSGLCMPMGPHPFHEWLDLHGGGRAFCSVARWRDSWQGGRCGSLGIFHLRWDIGPSQGGKEKRDGTEAEMTGSGEGFVEMRSLGLGVGNLTDGAGLSPPSWRVQKGSRREVGGTQVRSQDASMGHVEAVHRGDGTGGSGTQLLAGISRARKGKMAPEGTQGARMEGLRTPNMLILATRRGTPERG